MSYLDRPKVPQWLIKLLDWLLQDGEFPFIIKVKATAGITYHAIATSNEPAFRKIHQEIKKRVEDYGYELSENLATITIEFHVRRAKKNGLKHQA